MTDVKRIKLSEPKIDPKKMDQTGERLIRENIEWLKEMAKK